MPSSARAKGKKRALDDVSDSDAHSLSTRSTPVSEPVVVIKKPKRAVTRKCPVCDEDIPVRLLERHADLEAERVDEIMAAIGSVDVLDDAEPDDGHTARTRKSAAKARKNMQPPSRHRSPTASNATLELIDKSLRQIKRHRKDRHAKLRELSREDEDSGGRSFRGRRGDGSGTVCPVCLKVVPGDPDVVEAHVDACLAHEARMQEEREELERLQREATPWEEEVDVDGGTQMRATDGASLRGMGFAVRDGAQHDVEDDVDVDGEDEAVYGTAQFTEGDILRASADPNGEDENVDIDDDGDNLQSPGASGSTATKPIPKTVKDLAADGQLLRRAGSQQVEDEILSAGETEELDRAIDLAQKAGNTHALVAALQSKLKMLEATRVSSATSSLCRICLDPYTEPTVSTGCWHTCCRECWLRCLGSTKLCPICKRITAAADLRRIYL